MISPMVVAEIQRLLLEKTYSHRAIGRMLGISRNTVGSVALGRHRNIDAPSRDDEEEEPAGPPARCPTCGALVYLPCRLCRLQNELRANPKPPRKKENMRDRALLLELDLRPEHQARYEEVRMWRRRTAAVCV